MLAAYDLTVFRSFSCSAVAGVSKNRFDLGAIQNRLEHTIGNLDNIVENTVSVDSTIRNTGMTVEMVK